MTSFLRLLTASAKANKLITMFFDMSNIISFIFQISTTPNEKRHTEYTSFHLMI